MFNIKQFGLDLRSAQVRKLNLEADRIELDLAERRGELISVSDIMSVWNKVVMEFKDSVLNIPKNLSSLYDSINDAHELENIVEEFLYNALNNLSRAEFLITQITDNEE